eukprot:jgi/Picre1/28955/NNA_004349.t1
MQSALATKSAFHGNVHAFQATRNASAGAPSRGQLQIRAAGMKELRDRISSVKNTQKITEAMKLVAAAKVRRAQEAVVNGRPFAENLVKVLYGVNQRLQVEDVDSPLVQVRPVKKVLLVAETKELTSMGVDVSLVCIGRKGATYFKRRPQYTIEAEFEVGQSPTIKEAQAVADTIFADFVSEKVDKVELRELSVDIDGNCVDAAEDEVFKLTTREDPVQIVDALLPLYMNATLLRSLQEALASELAARMNAMNSASDNAGELKKKLNLVYNRKRQAKITTELTEIVSGASSV